MERYWAYSCRAYFASACDSLPSQIYNPVGDLVATTSSHFDWVVSTVNLDYRLAHLDYHREKLAALKTKYGEGVTIYDPSYLGSVLITSERKDISAAQMLEDLKIEETDHYFDRARAVRAAAVART